MTDQPEIESKAAFSRRLGVSKSWVSQLIAKGMPLTPDGKAVPVAAAIRWVRENIQQSEDGDGESTITEARTRLILAQAELAEINVLKERGSVIDRDEARRGVAAFARVYRDGLLNFAARQGPELAHKLGVDPRALIAELEAQLRQLLVDLARQPMPAASRIKPCASFKTSSPHRTPAGTCRAPVVAQPVDCSARRRASPM